jgi:16S rRNA (guanine(966)-N(2))-methyltransferase RsmD
MLQITGGELGGRRIHSLEGDSTRPSQAKLRQALYNSLQREVPGARVLDLFAGCGTLGIEALSRGAEWVDFFEAARPAAKVLERNIEDLGLRARARVHVERVEKASAVIAALTQAHGLYDLVVADPPYGLGVELDLVNGKNWSWDQVIAPGGKFVLEWGRTKSRFTELPDEVPFLVKVREKTYGDSILTTYERPA